MMWQTQVHAHAHGCCSQERKERKQQEKKSSRQRSSNWERVKDQEQMCRRSLVALL